MSDALSRQIGRSAVRLEEYLSEVFPKPEGALAQGLEFLRGAARVTEETVTDTAIDGTSRIATRLGWTSAEVELLRLALMPDEHEGYAAVLRVLNPRGEPRPTAGLAAQLLHRSNRPGFLSWFTSSALCRSRAVRVVGDAPFFERNLEPAEALWPALHGCDLWPAGFARHKSPPHLHGLEEWLATDAVRRICRALQGQVPCTILVTADSEETAFERSLALVSAAGRKPAGFHIHGATDPDKLAALKLHALLRGETLVIRMSTPETAAAYEPPAAEDHPDAFVVCGRAGTIPIRGTRPLIALAVERLPTQARRSVWSRTLPALQGAAPQLASRYPVEPGVAAEISNDLRCRSSLEDRASDLEDVAEAIRARGALSLSGGIKLIRPSASWDSLVLARDREEQLRAAIDRLSLQSRVLDEWGFLRGKPGARGVKMMFAGPPGTGKTLSAEVLATALRVDLLLVDISRVVSKWIGETEKNLASVFDAAERGQAVLFFDEADALFGRRTEVSDAHDRYANLETAYLLSRLERFEGLAILATNLRQNIDSAFLRRMDFVIEFDEPDREERHRIWRCHIPDEALLGEDANLHELAALYPVVGGLIRNATVAAAFLAAADGGRLTRAHFVRAMRREYEKAGKAFPGLPAGMRPT